MNFRLNHWALLAASLVLPVTAAMAQSTVPSEPSASASIYKYKTPKLNRAQIDNLLLEPKKVLFIDLRRPDEVSKIGTFPVYLNVQAKELEKHLAFIPKERGIVTVSNHAGRAGAAGDLLSDNGFKVLGAVGSQNYEEEGGTIVRIVPPATTPK